MQDAHRQDGPSRLSDNDGVREASSRLLERLIDEMPQALRRRALVSALDWSAVGASHVQRLYDNLEAAGREAPTWLSTLVLAAGHRIPEHITLRLPLELQTLALINSEKGARPSEDMERSLLRRAKEGQLDPDATQVLIGRLAAAGAGDFACRLALAIWEERPEAVKLVRRDIGTVLASMPQRDVKLIGFSTTDTLVQALRLALGSVGIGARVHTAPFGTALAELMNPQQELDGVLVHLDPQTFLAVDWRQPSEQRSAAIERRIEDFCNALDAHCQRSAAPVLINTLPAPALPRLGHHDAIDGSGAAGAARHINEKLAQAAASLPALRLIDTDAALSTLAPDARHDPRLWLYGRIAFSEPATRHLACAFARAFVAVSPGPAKVLAVDFDNTLWGGVYGDDGIGGLECGDDPPGNAFKAFQEECLRLKSQGMVLVALSKNNPDAIDAFTVHPGMLLKPEDFVATAIDWKPKADNIRRLARELNLGLDSFLFLDDSPHEREAMRRLCPEVRVPEMPADPALRPSWLRRMPSTWAVRPTEEDARRTELYHADRGAKELRESASSYEDYLAGLAQRLEVEPVDERTRARVAQLHLRTNQFNLTTARLTDADIAKRLAAPDRHAVLLGRVIDRFGDHGIVAACAITIDGRAAEFESFVMSCRVIAREIETAFLGAALKSLQERGVETVDAPYRPSPKNAISRDLYRNGGFIPVGVAQDGSERWRWTAATCPVPRTPHVDVIQVHR